MTQTPRPVVLCILDGWGIGQTSDDNAPLLAATPVMDHLMATCPNATLLTHGCDVGLPEGQMGNSEVGHTNIGAGRVVKMDLVEINDSIAAGEFAVRPALVSFVETLKASGGTAHLIGLVSDGGVHSQLAHLEAAVAVLVAAGVPVALHAITDGRDVAPKSADRFLGGLVKRLPEGARIATVLGRYFAMDRDNRWDRVERAYTAMVLGQGGAAIDALDAVSAAYAADKTDEFIPPSVVGDYTGMADGDGIFMLSYRADRAREILAAIGDPGFDAFDVSGRPDFAAKLGMVDYSKSHDSYMTAVFP
ncbi:MAG TPA: 2,3-bisphosphoglycerate-independent phosphoglycerate mutase, partial [Roseibacterium sp.]|nr:2,3-bisphosphoglycerate-independent phosphoglycerate mutase [Roseibacterium sp.]